MGSQDASASCLVSAHDHTFGHPQAGTSACSVVGLGMSASGTHTISGIANERTPRPEL